MKNFLTFLAILLSTVSFSQNVTVSIANLKVNNVTVPNGSPIDLGTNSSVNVTLRVDLLKDPSYYIGPTDLYIDVFDSYGNRTTKRTTFVSVSDFTENASANFDFDISASDVNAGNDNYLSATLKQENQPGAKWESGHIPIIKTPTFELSPSSLSLPCGDTSQRTFTVTNSAYSNGVTYQWNVGNGWRICGQ